MQEEVLQALAAEARHSDGTDASLPVEPLGCPPCRIIVAVGLVLQVQVEVIQSEFLHREVECTQGIPHLFLIEIGGGSINHPVRGLKGVGHDTFRFIHGNLEDAETDGRHHRTPKPLAESGDEALATRLRQMRLRHGAAPAGHPGISAFPPMPTGSH